MKTTPGSPSRISSDEDHSWQPIEDIICAMPNPDHHVVNNSGQGFATENILENLDHHVVLSYLCFVVCALGVKKIDIIRKIFFNFVSY